jgi:hypothetical protein
MVVCPHFGERDVSQEKRNLLRRLLPVMADLYDETAELSQGDGDLQLWYNRGYADGMVKAMRQLGYSAELDGVTSPAPMEADDTATFLPWGKAYRHGFEKGEQETCEALGG